MPICLNFKSRKSPYLWKILLALVLVNACKPELEEDIDGEIPIIELHGRPIPEIQDVKRPVVLPQVIDTFLVIFRQNDPLFQVYGTQSHQLLAEFGIRGDGPGEFLVPMPLHWRSTQASENPTYLISDMARRQIVEVDLHALVKGKTPFWRQRPFPDPDVVLDVTKVFYAQDGFFMGTESSVAKGELIRFFIVDENKGNKLEVKNFLDYPLSDNLLRDNLRLTSDFTYHPDSKKIAVFPRNFGRIDIYDLDGSHHKSFVFDQPPSVLGDASKPVVESNKTYFLQGLSTKDFVMGLSLDTPPGMNGILIRVFDWNANPKAVWRIESDKMSSFFYDESYHRLYLYQNERENDNLWVYDLPELTRN